MQVTVVVPVGNIEPEAGEQAGVPTPEQLSLAVAGEYVTTAGLEAAFTVLFAGQVIVGGVVSLTVTVVAAEAALVQPLVVTFTV